MRGLLAFIGARFGWDKSRASFIYTEAIYRCFKMELIYSDEIRWVHSVVWACFDCTSPGGSAVLLARMTRAPSVRSIKLKGQSRQQWCLRTFLGCERRFFHPTLQVIFRTYDLLDHRGAHPARSFFAVTVPVCLRLKSR